EPPARLTDGQLLGRFAAQGDESALATLIERHGPMVLSVGRRVLRDWHEAEDVFQATFLVLARRAGKLNRIGSVAPWLHTVAFRLALRARTQSSRWRRCSRPVGDIAMTTNDSEAAWELRPVLDEELERLPAKYRAPLVLCYLEGKTLDETAEHLGWPRGTVGGRLARAKDLMRRRLTRRGVTPGAAFLGPALADRAPAALPAGLTASTAKAALSFVVERASPGAATSTAALLAQGELRTMMQSKLAMTAATLLFLGATGVGAVVLGQQALTQPPRHDAPKQAAEATPARLDANSDPPARKEKPLPLTPVFRQNSGGWRFAATYRNTTAGDQDLPTLLQESSIVLDGKVHGRRQVKFGGRSNLHPDESWTFTIEMVDYLGKDLALAGGRHTVALNFGKQKFGPVEFVWAPEGK
ncbi:MAG TPA: sigma-70 family RNA polymerase sigma factor, partial [Gemmataceae bacterium]|nr:sigma-70 family RNA polymerase sigma factor [Gemmataceae bacterium]